jgi:ATP-dependent DNA ligase
MHGAAFCIEVKLDGERLLAHIGGRSTPRVFMHARKLEDFTDSYKPLGRDIRSSLKYDVSCILDGEVLSWDLDSNVPVPFGANKTVALEELNHEEALSRGQNPLPLSRKLKYMIFDVVYLHGPDAALLVAKHIEGRDKKILPDLPSVVTEGDITTLPLAIRRNILEDLLQQKEKRLLIFYLISFSFT